VTASLRDLSAAGEQGQIGGVEALIFGLLVFVLGSLVISNAWGVIDAKLAADGAAREGTRAFVESPVGVDPASSARQAAMEAITAEGRDRGRATVVVSGALVRCSRVSVIVSYRVPIIVVPFLGGLGNGFVASAQRSELVDPYRNGVPGQAECAAT
jgi:hypothetical protein